MLYIQYLKTSTFNKFIFNLFVELVIKIFCKIRSYLKPNFGQKYLI